MADTHARNLFDANRRLSIYQNLIWMTKVLSVPTALGGIGLFYSSITEVPTFAIVTLILYPLLFFLCQLLIRHKWIRNFEDWSGCLVSIFVSVVKAWSDIEIAKHSGVNKMIAPRYMTLLNTIHSFMFIQNTKVEIIMETFFNCFYFVAKFYFLESVSAEEVIDGILCINALALLSYTNNKKNQDLFSSFYDSLKNAILDLGKGMDLISENMCMISVDNKKEMSLYQCSNKFMDAYVPKSMETQDLYDILSLFRSVHLDHNKVPIVVEEHSLYRDITDFVNKGEKSENGQGNYKARLYAYKKIDGTYHYFRVKYVFYNPQVLSNHEIFLLILFNNLDDEDYHMKSQQISAFSNVLVSSLTHELKNPLNGLAGQIDSINADLLDKFKMHKLCQELFKVESNTMINLKLLNKESQGLFRLIGVPVEGSVTESKSTFVDRLMKVNMTYDEYFKIISK